MKKIKCPDCKKEFDQVTGCDHRFIIIEGGVYARIKHDGNSWCPNCFCYKGQTHHFGCDKETCPRDFKPLMDCTCKVSGVIKAKNISEAEQVFTEKEASPTKSL